MMKRRLRKKLLGRMGTLVVGDKDCLVLMLEDRLPASEHERLRAQLANLFPGTRCIVLDGGASFGVIREQKGW